MIVEVEIPPHPLHRRMQTTHKPSPLYQSTADHPPFPPYSAYSSSYPSASLSTTEYSSVLPSTNGPSATKESSASNGPSTSNRLHPASYDNVSSLPEPVPLPNGKSATQLQATTWNGPPNSVPTPPSTNAPTGTSTPALTLATTPPPPKPSSSTAPNPQSGPSTLMVSQTRNYIVLEAQGATPQEDMKYLFGDHIDWASLKVLPKNHPSSAYFLSISRLSDCFTCYSSVVSPSQFGRLRRVPSQGFLQNTSSQRVAFRSPTRGAIESSADS